MSLPERIHMSQEYRYRSHIRWGQYAIPVFFAGVTGLLWHLAESRLIPVDPELGLTLRPALLAFSITLLVVGAPVWYLFHHLAGISVTIEDDAIIYRYRTGEKRIGLGSILRVRFGSIPYLGGWVKIVSEKHKIRLTVVLEDIGGFLQELKASLDSERLSDRYDEAQFFRFLKTAAFSDQSWARLYSIFWKLVLFELLGSLTGLAFAALGDGSLYLWVLLSALWPVAVYSCTEILFGRRLAREAVKESFTFPRRDIDYERAVYRKAILIGASLYIGLAVFIALSLSWR